jgi:hypothetical protein
MRGPYPVSRPISTFVATVGNHYMMCARPVTGFFTHMNAAYLRFWGL